MLPLQVLVSWQILYLGVVSFFLNTFRLDEKFGADHFASSNLLGAEAVGAPLPLQ